MLLLRVQGDTEPQERQKLRGQTSLDTSDSQLSLLVTVSFLTLSEFCLVYSAGTQGFF